MMAGAARGCACACVGIGRGTCMYKEAVMIKETISRGRVFFLKEQLQTCKHAWLLHQRSHRITARAHNCRMC